MAALGPFEDRPRIAVAVSGGADSLALAVLVDRWAAARGGEAIGLVVDHRLRPEATAEARQVRRWLAARGIDNRILVWRRAGGHPSAAVQARARGARYELLTGWCRQHGVLHLALAHHAGDQAETVLMRLARGGGIDGLAGMAAVAARDGVRLIRPLLALDPRRLRASLAKAGQPWIEDPSNRDERFERVRWRRVIPPEQRLALALAAGEIGGERRARERQVAERLAHGRLDPRGSFSLSLATLLAAAPDIALAALGRALLAVGGRAYPARRESLERLMAHLAAGGPARTLGGCRIAAREGRLLVSPEAGNPPRSARQSAQPLAPAGFTVAKLNVNIM